MDSNPICARETHVSGQLNEARKLTGALHSQMQILREKLNPVFRNEPRDQTDSKDAGGIHYLVPLAQELWDHNQGLNHLLGIVNDMIERIEL